MEELALTLALLVHVLYPNISRMHSHMTCFTAHHWSVLDVSCFARKQELYCMEATLYVMVKHFVLTPITQFWRKKMVPKLFCNSALHMCYRSKIKAVAIHSQNWVHVGSAWLLSSQSHCSNYLIRYHINHRHEEYCCVQIAWKYIIANTNVAYIDIA